MTTTSLWTREHEVLLEVRPTQPVLFCSAHHDKVVVEGKFCWDHRITTGRPGEWALGEDWFPCMRHADGTPCQVEGHEPRTTCFTRSQCPECGAFDSFLLRQEAWADDVTCGTEGCGFHQRYSIGD